VSDIRLAIASKNCDSFTRPLPLSTIKQVAQSKNDQRLEKIDTIASITDENENVVRTGKPQALPSTLPASVEATVLVNPNL
jgi:hypothetical protein